MLTLEDIKPPNREYWINVYKNNRLGARWVTKDASIRGSWPNRPLYRIHVKIKDEKRI